MITIYHNPDCGTSRNTLLCRVRPRRPEWSNGGLIGFHAVAPEYIRSDSLPGYSAELMNGSQPFAGQITRLILLRMVPSWGLIPDQVGDGRAC